MINIKRACRVAITAGVFFLVTSLTAQAADSVPVGQADFNIAATTPGAVLSAQVEPTAAVLAHAGQRVLMTYRSRGADGEPIVTSAYVLLPKGEPPAHGWPVLAWAHGTTGVADICAPSGIYAGGPESGYHQLVLPVLDAWLAQGYAVVAPDYQGLGTPGGHPYMNANSQLHTVVDAVRALHRLRPDALSPDWLVMGHSQGGAAALAVAAGADAAPLQLRGAIAIAPGGYHYDGIAQYALDNDELSPGVAAFLPIVLLGAEAAQPALQVDELVSQEMQPLMQLARSRCLSGLREEITASLSQVFKADADLQPLLTYLDRQSIQHMAPRVPVLFIQGSDDALVGAAGTQAYYQQLCQAGKTVFYHSVEHGSHRDALNDSWPVAKAFLAYLNGQDAALPSCTATDSDAANTSL